MQQNLVELSKNQTRQYIDAEALLRAYRQARQEALEVRGSMIWREMRGVRYLIRTSAAGAQKSIGVDSADMQAIYARFMARKQAASTRVKTLTLKLTEQRKLNRVYRVGRTPNVVVRILQQLEKAGVAEQFLTVGTHALYAYESACGVMVGTEALATRDIDLLFDTRKRLAFLSAMKHVDTSLIGVLKKADPSFQVRRDQLQTATNDEGFEVDLIRRDAAYGDPHPLRMTDDENGLWAVQVASGEKMLATTRFEQMVVGVSGEMAMMHTLHPLTFIRVKTSLANSATRDPLKRGKDLLQAQIVQHLWDEYLHLRVAI
jgi:hypothetical protein